MEWFNYQARQQGQRPPKQSAPAAMPVVEFEQLPRTAQVIRAGIQQAHSAAFMREVVRAEAGAVGMVVMEHAAPRDPWAGAR